jgi:hypothetical protein
MVAAARLAYATYSHIGYDDAHISLRYAVNLAAGHGLVYNPGERVFGASAPLYVLLLAAFARTGLAMPLLAGPAPLAWGKVLCIAADTATAWMWYGLLLRESGSRWPGRLFALFFGLSPFIIETTVSGMETSLVLFAMTLGMTLAMRANATPGVKPSVDVKLGATVGLLGLVRPDALVFGGVLLAFYAAWWRRVPWRALFVAAACLAPWYLFATHYYGSPIPNSVFAKVAAYNDHNPSYSRAALTLWSSIGPYRNGFGAETFKWVSSLLLIIGLLRLRAHPRLAVLPAAALAYLAFLIVPHTLLFRWYLPPLLLPLYAIAALGTAPRASGHQAPSPLLPFSPSPLLPVVLASAWLALAGHTALWTARTALRARHIQWAEDHIRRDIGVWLRENAPAHALVAAEPIGYIGYYSGRPILDEVGLVSPRMIPLNRAGDGWFGKMLRAEQPDYVVERSYYLTCNQTLNSGVRMFATEADREWFQEQYAPVKNYCWDLRARLHLSELMTRDYGFIIYARRALNPEARLSRSPVLQLQPQNEKIPGNSGRPALR